MQRDQLDLGNKKTFGSLWIRKPLPNNEGVILKVTHSTPGSHPLDCRNVRFLQFAFDFPGTKLLTADQYGNIAILDFDKNRFKHVCRLTVTCTALSFANSPGTHHVTICVGTSDCTFRIYHASKGEQSACLKGHATAICNISSHSSREFVVSTSCDTGIIWNVETYCKLRKLTLKQELDILKIIFLPESDTILTCFKEGSIFGCSFNEINVQFKFQLPEPPCTARTYTCVALSPDGKNVAASARKTCVHVWDLESNLFKYHLELPQGAASCKHLQLFVAPTSHTGPNQELVLSVVGMDGILLILDMNNNVLHSTKPVDLRLCQFTMNLRQIYAASLLTDGTLQIFDVASLFVRLGMKEVAKESKPESSARQSLTEKATREKVSKQFKKEKPVRQPLVEKASGEPHNIDHNQKSHVPDVATHFDRDRLNRILKGCGEYPEKYRLLIWRILLQLPENVENYKFLVGKGIHPAFRNLQTRYPFKSGQLLQVMQKMLSALAHWAPAALSEGGYLPLFIFPFVKLFRHNHFVCFEVLMSLVNNWCKHWFEFYPAPPLNVLSIVENMLAKEDKKLLLHFIHRGFTTQAYAWPLLQTALSEFLSKKDWLIVWDHLLSNHPAFLAAVTVSLLVACRNSLIKIVIVDDLRFFVHHRQTFDIRAVIRDAYRIYDAALASFRIGDFIEEYQPLPVCGVYPEFKHHSRYVEDFHIQERERLRQEELDYLKKRKEEIAAQNSLLMTENLSRELRSRHANRRVKSPNLKL